jgi:hypothetical protein
MIANYHNELGHSVYALTSDLLTGISFSENKCVVSNENVQS